MSIFQRIHAFLLPEDLELGSGPYIWLCYSLFLVIPLATGNLSPTGFWLTLATLIPFLVLYFLAFRQTGWRLRFVVAAISALGLILMPFNWGAMTYLIFAGSFAAFVGPPRDAIVVLVGVLGVFALEWWLLDGPLQVLLITILVTTIVGAANIVWRAIHIRNQALKASREEVERLGALAERERIARDLHDVLGHTLSSITLKSALAARIFDSDPVRARDEMIEVEEIARRALTQARTAVSGYRSTSIRDEIARGRKLLAAAGVVLKASVDESLIVSAELNNVLGLALREALTNVARHAGANECHVTARKQGSRIELLVADDGHGATPIPGDGLKGMAERLENVGGSVDIQASQGSGVRLAICAPVAASKLDSQNRQIVPGESVVDPLPEASALP